MLRSILLGSRVSLAGLALAGALALMQLASPQTSPVSAHVDRKLQGAELFATRGCTHCHGTDGTGTDNGPSLRSVRKQRSTAQIRNQIVHGGKEMPAFGDTLTRDQVSSLVTFLRARTWITPPAQPGNSPPQ